MNLWHNCITHIVSVVIGGTVMMLMVLTAPETDSGSTSSGNCDALPVHALVELSYHQCLALCLRWMLGGQHVRAWVMRCHVHS